MHPFHDDHIRFQYEADLFSKGICTSPFFKAIEDNLPPVFSRQEASKVLGGLISPKTFANLDCSGKGPSVKIRTGSRVGYERASFMAWLRKHLKSL